jgi:hypothetical protein
MTNSLSRLNDITKKELIKLLVNQSNIQKEANDLSEKQRFDKMKKILELNNGSGNKFHRLRKFAEAFIDLYERLNNVINDFKKKENA